ncbi:MAG: Nucleotidyltransferase/DNA polymerase involved in repair [Candidatus Saccharibacteria bacterium]|nr:Nucleotidyltransferase/DNA polymerase involved in repair [Candidatus Saccharibacteria bacterium]
MSGPRNTTPRAPKGLLHGRGLNAEEANIMHIDLNSCFATVEQQAHPSLRGRPLGITNRLSPRCCVIACSYEAKALGIKVGTALDEAKAICPEFIMLQSDPPKYHHVYKKLVAIMQSYSPKVQMKSIDEGIIDFHGTREHINTRSLEEIGEEIKGRLRTEVGSWMKCNIGIAPNRFLAKLAAGLHKPDGMDRIDHKNLRQVLSGLKLTDLPGIAEHYEARLNAAGIFTPLEFLDTSSDALRRFVFHSINGEHWYNRLHGWEADDFETKIGNVGRQFVMDKSTNNESILLPRFHYLCQTTGMKLRFNNVDARGIMVWADFQNGESFALRKMYKSTFYTDQEVYRRALYLFNQRPKHMIVTRIGVTCYQLTPSTRAQASLLEDINKAEWLTTAIDDINEKYGSFTVSYGTALEGKNVVKQKIPFGSTQYFELLLNRA